MFKNFKLRTKIFLLLATVTLAAITFISYLNYTTSMKAHTTDSYNSLTSIRDMKAMQVEDYINNIRNQISTLSESTMIIEAMKSFSEGYKDIAVESDISNVNIEKAKNRLGEYYSKQFFPKLSKNTMNSEQLDKLIPKDITSIILQDIFISNNSFPTGEKHKLIDGSENTSYGKTHKKYHPIIKNFLDKFGFYDIFLIDHNSGSIVYSVFKEIDYATSLKDGPYSKTNFAEVFNTSSISTEKDFVKLADFSPYMPSYNDNASFIAAPIYDGEKKVGILVFQMPVNKINNIMTNHENWKSVGLGDSGETYIVGDDYTLRNQSRFLIEDKENYIKLIKSLDTDKNIIEKITSLNNSIGLQVVKTKGTEAALKGQSGTEIFDDYRGIPVLSSYKPLKIKDVHWVIMSEIDDAEAFSDVREMRKISIILFIITLLVVMFSALVFSRRITEPLQKLQDSANELASGNLDVEIENKNKDEIGDLANSFIAMRDSIKKLLGIFDLNIISSKTDLKGKITYVSKAFVEISEFSKDELIGQPHSSVRHPDMPKEVFKDLWKTIKAGNTWRGEIKNIKKGGGFYWVDAIISPEFDNDGSIVGYSALRHDITAKKETEALKDSLEIKVEERTKEIKEAYDELDEYKNNLEIKVEEEIAKRQETMKLKERMEGELNVAHDIQMSMIPLLFPVFTDYKEFSIFADMQPAREVGGDFYDFYFIDKDHVCLVIGDVSGKGVPAALFMAVSKTLIKSRASNDLSPSSILSYVNDEMSVDNPASMFVTLFVGVLNLNSGIMQYTNAGHNPPYMIRNDGTLECLTDRHGPIVGAVEGVAYSESSLEFKDKDKLFLFTDGVTEAMNIKQELYGEDRLEKFLLESSKVEVIPLINDVINDVHEHETGKEQSDDITALAFEFFSKDHIRSQVVSIPNKIESLPAVMLAFESFTEEHSIPMPVALKMNIVLDDVVTNVISYAYEDDLEHTIDLRFEYTEDDKLSIIISDDGISFNPFNQKEVDTTLSIDERDIGGLGIHLVKKMLDDYAYSRNINQNIVTLIINLKKDK